MKYSKRTKKLSVLKATFGDNNHFEPQFMSSSPAENGPPPFLPMGLWQGTLYEENMIREKTCSYLSTSYFFLCYFFFLHFWDFLPFCSSSLLLSSFLGEIASTFFVVTSFETTFAKEDVFLSIDGLVRKARHYMEYYWDCRMECFKKEVCLFISNCSALWHF